MRTKPQWMALILVTCAAVGSRAYALDSKVLPGSACQPIQAALATDITRRGSLFNTQGTDIGIDCPVVRDNATNISGPVTATVRVKGNGNRVQCDLSSYDRSGTIIAFDRKEVTSTGPSTLTLQVSQSVFRGAYSLSCSLPAGGELINYTVAEPTSTDTD